MCNSPAQIPFKWPVAVRMQSDQGKHQSKILWRGRQGQNYNTWRLKVYDHSFLSKKGNPSQYFKQVGVDNMT